MDPASDSQRSCLSTPTPHPATAGASSVSTGEKERERLDPRAELNSCFLLRGSQWSLINPSDQITRPLQGREKSFAPGSQNTNIDSSHMKPKGKGRWRLVGPARLRHIYATRRPAHGVSFPVETMGDHASVSGEARFPPTFTSKAFPEPRPGSPGLGPAAPAVPCRPLQHGALLQPQRAAEFLSSRVWAQTFALSTLGLGQVMTCASVSSRVTCHFLAPSSQVPGMTDGHHSGWELILL